MTVILPTKKVRASTKSPRILILYGPPKVGKTTILSQLPSCLTLDIERGTELLDSMKVQANNWEEVEEIGKQILRENKPYKYVAIDTITKLEEWAEARATQDYMASTVGKNFNRKPDGTVLSKKEQKSVLTLPMGAGYLWLRMAYLKWLNSLYKLADRVILVGHIKDKLINIKDKEVSSKDIDLTGKLKAITCSQADAIGYIYRQEGKMWVTFETEDEITCGARCEHLKGNKFEFDWSKIYVD